MGGWGFRGSGQVLALRLGGGVMKGAQTLRRCQGSTSSCSPCHIAKSLVTCTTDDVHAPFMQMQHG
jgi:hypothetical protein